MRTSRKRVQVPFLFRASDGVGASGKVIARSYGNEVEGVYARAGAAYMRDADGVMPLVPYGLPRFTSFVGEHLLVLEGEATNLLLRSREFGNATWTSVGTPTISSDVWMAPDQSLTADGILDSSAVELRGKQQAVTVLNDSANYCASVYIRKLTSAPGSASSLYLNFTGGTPVEAYLVFDRFTGTSVASGASNAGVIDAGDYWLVFVARANNATGNTTATVSIYPASHATVAAGATDATQTGPDMGTWEAFLEKNALTPSSAKTTTTVAATRVADSLYFPFSISPLVVSEKALTIYVRGVNLGLYSLQGATRRVLHIGDANTATDPRVSMGLDSSNRHFAQHDNASTNATSQAAWAVQPVRHDLVEHRVTLGTDGTVTSYASLNGGTEQSASGNAAALAVLSPWANTRLYLTGGMSAENGAFGYTHVAVAFGTKTRAEVRELAEVY